MDKPLPSRGNFYSSRHVWLKEIGEAQRQRLGHAAHEWVVHKKVYDLASYLDSHPGGRAWLDLTRGMDVTPLFESHHVNDAKTQAILRKFYIRDCKTTTTSPSATAEPLAAAAPSTPTRLETWPSVAGTPSASDFRNDDPEADFSFRNRAFYKIFKRRAAKVLEKAEDSSNSGSARGARGPTTEMRVLVWILLSAWLLSLAWCCREGAGVGPAVVAGVLLNALTGIGHNAMHSVPSWWRYLMDLSLFSSEEWRISHCISHHHYPGSQIDFEVAAIEPFIHSLYSGPPSNQFLPFYLWWVLCILGPFELLARGMNVFFLRIQPLRWENLLPFMELGLLIVFAGGGKGGVVVGGEGLKKWVVMHVAASVLMGLQALPLHHSEHAWMDGKDDFSSPPSLPSGEGKRDKSLLPASPSPPSSRPTVRPIDFGLHALRATQDYDISELPLLAKLVLFPFNHHRLHHLLPSVDESRLPLLEEALKETCEDVGAKYIVYPWRELAWGTVRHWIDIGGERRRKWAERQKSRKRE
ncbi:hypothetical protein VYU27_003336 [Nannochloropsis oceanica]